MTEIKEIESEKKIRLNVMLTKDQYEKLDKIAKQNYSDKSKQIRKWISLEKLNDSKKDNSSKEE